MGAPYDSAKSASRRHPHRYGLKRFVTGSQNGNACAQFCDPKSCSSIETMRESIAQVGKHSRPKTFDIRFRRRVFWGKVCQLRF